MRILLIEDDPLIGDGLKIGLTKSGFGVDWFTNGADGEEHTARDAHPHAGSGADGCAGQTLEVDSVHLSVEHDGEDEGHDGEDQGDGSEDPVDRGDLVVDDRDDRGDEREDSRDETDDRRVGVVELHVGELLSLDSHSPAEHVHSGHGDAGTEPQDGDVHLGPGEEHPGNHQHGADESDDSHPIDIT